MRQGDVVHFVHTDHLGSTSLTTDAPGAPIAQTRYRPYGEQRWQNGETPTDFTFTGQRGDSFGLLDYNARYYDSGLGRFISPDTIVPEPGNPQSFNRYSYAYNNSVRYTDPSGHANCAADDRACWENRWYRAHGYESVENEWAYTGNYYFEDKEAAYETIDDIRAGRHSVSNLESLNFTYNSFTFSLVRRGQDNLGSKLLSTFAFATDIVDTGVTAAFAMGYTIEQLATSTAGPPGTAGGFVVGEIAYLATVPALTAIDVAGLTFIGFADGLSGRTELDFKNRQAYIGLDTVVSLSTFTASSGSYLVPVAPGVYVALAGDVVQLGYDFARAARLPGYSLQMGLK